ncbi:MAG: AI-2E family transporter [Burkholderiales bacterium]|nr:AI-2E family transporter [Burkholderiales bacterium]
MPAVVTPVVASSPVQAGAGVREAATSHATEAPTIVAPRLTVIEIAALIVATVAVIAVAHLARAFLVPLVAGILLAYALRPLVSVLERWHIPHGGAAFLVIGVLTTLLSAAGYAFSDEFNSAMAELPGAARKIRVAVTASTRTTPGPISNVTAAAAELDRAAAEATGKSSLVAATAPTGVAAQFQDFIAQRSETAMVVMGQIVLAVLLSLFLLAAGDTFRRKVARMAGESLRRRRITVQVLDEINANVQRYLLTLLIANVLIGLATWIALALLGLPRAGMWGAVTGLLHVIPYAGAAVAAIGIGIAMFLHSSSIGLALLAAVIVVAIATMIGIGFLTWMQGKANRMNAVAVFVGVLFFGWLWGGWGLLLGLPILAVIKSVCDRIDALSPVSELLGT